MQVTVNGDPLDLPPQTTIAQLLESLGRARELCAVEVNEALAPKRERDAITLCEGDRVEIVTLVGGG